MDSQMTGVKACDIPYTGWTLYHLINGKTRGEQNNKLGSLLMPIIHTNGTSNANNILFGVLFFCESIVLAFKNFV